MRKLKVKMERIEILISGCVLENQEWLGQRPRICGRFPRVWMRRGNLRQRAQSFPKTSMACAMHLRRERG